MDCLSRVPNAIVHKKPKDADDIVWEQSSDRLCQYIRSYVEDRILWDEKYRKILVLKIDIDFFSIEYNFLCRAQAPTSEKRRPKYLNKVEIFRFLLTEMTKNPIKLSSPPQEKCYYPCCNLYVYPVSRQLLPLAGRQLRGIRGNAEAIIQSHIAQFSGDFSRRMSE